jgi:hypothetical protein
MDHNTFVAVFGGGGSGGFCAEYKTIHDAMTNKPFSSVAQEQNTLVKTLVDVGVWAKLDLFYLFAQESNNDSEALINWVTPGTYNCSLPVAPTFTALEGFTGDASTQYINTNWNPSANGVNYKLNNASMGVYVRSYSSGLYCFGADVGPNETWLIINQSNNTRIRMHNNLTGGVANGANYIGTFISERVDVNTINLYRNKTRIINEGANVSVAIPNAEVFILGMNLGGLNNPCMHK